MQNKESESEIKDVKDENEGKLKQELWVFVESEMLLG